MAQPKRRWSKLPHTLCSNCGYYDGKKIVDKKEEE